MKNDANIHEPGTVCDCCGETSDLCGEISADGLCAECDEDACEGCGEVEDLIDGLCDDCRKAAEEEALDEIEEAMVVVLSRLHEEMEEELRGLCRSLGVDESAFLNRRTMTANRSKAVLNALRRTSA